MSRIRSPGLWMKCLSVRGTTSRLGAIRPKTSAERAANRWFAGAGGEGGSSKRSRLAIALSLLALVTGASFKRGCAGQALPYQGEADVRPLGMCIHGSTIARLSNLTDAICVFSLL